MSEELMNPSHLFEEGSTHIPPEEEEDAPVQVLKEGSAPFSPGEEADITGPHRVEDNTLDAITADEVKSIPKLEDIESVRRLILALHPSVVPELINGDSVSDLIASIQPAEEAYGRIVANVRIPAGGNAPIAFDADTLPTFDKIRRGLSAQTQRKV